MCKLCISPTGTEPNDAGPEPGEDCCVSAVDGHWNDVTCSLKRKVICQLISPGQSTVAGEYIIFFRNIDIDAQ